ncbi:MAG: PQQ-binding-like beta-propeller repeat protein [Planctomycetota bacterium]|nr:PQQ-binding-like beta-propeller repeat protein [Planctomycetota bacterium]
MMRAANLPRPLLLAAGLALGLAGRWKPAPPKRPRLIHGWRGDGSGRFPEAAPPAEFSPEKNVVWSTKLPGWSNASPAMAGERIFVCVEPDVLVCVNKANGAILWQQASPVLETYPEADRAKLKERLAAALGEAKEREDLRKQLPTLSRTARLGGENKEKFEAAKARVRELDAKLAETEKLLPPRTNEENGYSSATPVTDGQAVYVVFSTGVAACYGLDGTRRWIVYLEKPFHTEWGHAASPVLAGGLLLVHFNRLTALKAATGEQAWQAEATPSFGSPIAAKIGATDVLITPAAEVVRVSDGKILAKAREAFRYTYEKPVNSPVLAGNAAIFTDEAGACALELPAEAGETIELKERWAAKIKRATYYASPLVHDGLVYALSKEGDLTVLDEKTGEIAATRSFKDLARGGVFYPNLALAGKWIYLAHESGASVWLEPGKEMKEAGRNMLEFCRGAPVFESERMYVRAKDHLFCLGK